MVLNFLSSSSILKKFLVFNFVVFLVLSIFTFLYLQDIEPNLVNNRSKQHDKIISAIKFADGDLAEAEMRAHMETSLTHRLNILQVYD